MSLGRNILKIFTNRVASSSILFVTMPIVARMFTPDDFGVRQIFISILGLLGVAACFRYELSIPLAKNDTEASASFALSAMISLILSLLMLAIIPFVKSQVASWFKSPDLELFLWLIPIGILMESLRRSLQYWAAYSMRFGIMAWSGFVSAAIAGLTPIAWYFIYGRSPAGLLAAIFSGGTIAILIFLITFFRVLIAGLKDCSFRSIIDIAKYYKKFPIYSTWGSFLNTLSRNMPTFILGLYFPLKIVGYYSLANRIITFPSSLLGTSIGQVFYPTAGKEYNKTGDISGLVRNTVRRLAQIGIFPMVAIGFYGAPLFGFVFGQNWVEAGIYAQILSIFLLSQFITSPITVIFAVKAYQDKELIYNIVLSSGRFLALFLASQMNNPRITLGAYAIISFTVYALTLAWLLRLSNISVKWGLKIMLKYIFGSAMLLLPTLFFVYRGHSIFTILASLVLETMLYVSILCKMDTSLQVQINAVFRSVKGFSAKL